MAEVTFSAMSAPKLRAYNRCRFDIGVMTAEGRQYNIKPGSFIMLTVDDINYIDSICQKKKFFASGMLEAVDANGAVVDLDKLGIAENEDEPKMLTDVEITASLKKSVKAVEAWLKEIDDPVELHAIYRVACDMDLPASKLKILNAKMPNRDWLDEMG